MAKILSKILNKLPLYERCGGCVYNLKLGAVLSFIFLFAYTCLIYYEVVVLWKNYLLTSRLLLVIQVMTLVMSAICAGLFVLLAFAFFVTGFGKNMLIAQLLTLTGLAMALFHILFDILVCVRPLKYNSGYAFYFFKCDFRGTINEIEFAYMVRDNKDDYHFITLYMDFLIVHFIIAIYSYARYLNGEDDEKEVSDNEQGPSTSRA